MHHRPAFKTHFREKLGALNCNNCYQLLGVDVMLAADLSPMIIEVNGSPSMQLGQGLGATLTQDDISTDYVRPCGAPGPLVFTQHAWFAHHSTCSKQVPCKYVDREACNSDDVVYIYIYTSKGHDKVLVDGRHLENGLQPAIGSGRVDAGAWAAEDWGKRRCFWHRPVGVQSSRPNLWSVSS